MHKMSAGYSMSALDALESTLEIERQLLETLLFELSQADFVVGSGEAHFAAPAHRRSGVSEPGVLRRSALTMRRAPLSPAGPSAQHASVDLPRT
jgi:hypothetical protein